MALMMVKTHDLSWQDRTVNVEFMFAPARNQLLLNKHKTLGTKCQIAKRFYEKERDSILKDMDIEKRVMEKKKQTLLRKKSDIMVKRVSTSAISDRSGRKTTTTAANVSTKRSGSAPAKIDRMTSNSPGIFLTDFKNSSYSEPRSRAETVITESEGGLTPVPSGNRIVQAASASLVSTSSRRVVSPFGSKRSSRRIKSVRFDDNRIPELQENSDYKPEPKLDCMVQRFVKAQIEFNEKPVRFHSGGHSQQEQKYPLVAKRYSSLSLNKEKLIDAFDNFCFDSNKDEFQKLVRLASKLKSSVKMARNQSVLPSVAAFKSGKVFKDQLKQSNVTATW